MPKGYLIHLETGAAMEFVDFVAISPVEGVPPRPTPGPTPPGPVDPGYSPPWAQVPGNGGPGPGGPVDPGYSPPWAQVPGAGPGTLAYMYPAPEGVTPPSDPVPAGWTVKVISEKGADGPSWAYIGPHLQHNK